MAGTVLAVTILVTGSILPAWAGVSAGVTTVKAEDRKGNTTVSKICPNATQKEFLIQVRGKTLIELGNGFTTKAPGGTDTVRVVFGSLLLEQVIFEKKGNPIGSISAGDIVDSIRIDINAKIVNNLVCGATIPKGTVHLSLQLA